MKADAVQICGKFSVDSVQYKMGQDFLDTLYLSVVVSVEAKVVVVGVAGVAVLAGGGLDRRHLYN